MAAWADILRQSTANGRQGQIQREGKREEAVQQEVEGALGGEENERTATRNKKIVIQELLAFCMSKLV
eukprot:750360-Hanusia_phi.AAC.1